MDMTFWCSLCNAAPSEGVLTVEDPVTKMPIELNACQACVDKLDWK